VVSHGSHGALPTIQCPLPTDGVAHWPLQVLKLDGCIGLSTLPAGFAHMASLRTINVTHCLKLLGNEAALKARPTVELRPVPQLGAMPLLKLNPNV
jgi:hypothetical protein